MGVLEQVGRELIEEAVELGEALRHGNTTRVIAVSIHKKPNVTG